MASSILDTKILPSPMRPVWAARRIASIAFSTSSSPITKVHDVLGTAIEFGVTLLPPETLGFGDGDALQSDFLKRFFHLVELEWLDDGFDFFH
jgi:hypothetical protein